MSQKKYFHDKDAVRIISTSHERCRNALLGRRMFEGCPYAFDKVRHIGYEGEDTLFDFEGDFAYERSAENDVKLARMLGMTTKEFVRLWPRPGTLKGWVASHLRHEKVLPRFHVVSIHPVSDRDIMQS